MTRRLALDELEGLSGAFDEAVMGTENIDTFCSASEWILPAFAAFHPDSELFAFEVEGSVLPLARSVQPKIGRYLAPLEAMWGLACPVAAPEPERTVPAIVTHFRDIEAEWDTLWLCGLARGSALFQSLVTHLSPHYRLGLGPATRRHTARLEGGWDGYLGRRSPHFRRNLRRALRRFEAGPLTVETISPALCPEAAETVYARILAIEGRSWKGGIGSGILDPGMEAFYRDMVQRLAERGALRVMIAQDAGQDVAFVLGGMRQGLFRGLQLSFDGRYRRESLGNVMQGLMIRHLCDQGAHTYDLGTDMAYKSRWGEPGLCTEVLAVLKT